MSACRRLWLLLLVVASAACEGSRLPTEDPGPLVIGLRFVDPPSFAWEGQSVPIQVQAINGDNQGVAGVRVHFRAALPGGVPSEPSAVTDSLGLARVSFTLGPGQNGWNAIEAFVDDPAVAPVRQGISTGARPRISFARDSVVLARTGAADTLFARVLNANGDLMPGESVTFTATNPGVISFFGLMVSGSVRGMMAGVRGEQVGTTRVIATHASGAADTAFVKVLASPP
jgi:hypothetical protein